MTRTVTLAGSLLLFAANALAQAAESPAGADDARYYDFWPGTWHRLVDGAVDTTQTEFRVVHARTSEHGIARRPGMRVVGFSRVSGLVALVACAVPTSTLAQAAFPPVALPHTEVRSLHSREVGVQYKLYVSVPKDYETTSRAYPVVLLLDADYSFAVARNVVEHLSDRGDLTRAILVGIAYDGPDAYRMNRTRDYTPTHVPGGGYGPEYQAVSGGGTKFRDFIARELVPFLEDEYRLSSQRYLVGHSYGGLFATWVALTTPNLFTGYVIVSPSLWYGDGLLFRLEREVASRRSDLPVRAYMTVGDREVNQQHDMVADLRRLASTLESRHYPGLRLRWDVAEGETHNSVFPRGVSNGLRFVLEGRD